MYIILSAMVTGPVSGAMLLGVQTHFSQGWPLLYLPRARQLNAQALRDSILWAQAEKTPGHYDFSAPSNRWIDEAIAAGMEPLVTFGGGNKLYDDGKAPYSESGRQAYARFIIAALAHYHGRIRSIEIWNEYNTNSVTGPAAADKAAYYAMMLKTVYPLIKAADPKVRIVAGATNTIATGFFDRIFAQGGLPFLDAVSIHPYRATPDHVDDEIARLRATMARYGPVKPVLVTEFGNKFTDRAEAPDYLLKMVTLLGAAQVQAAYWYALRDQDWYPTMGLLNQQDGANPAAAAFAFAAGDMRRRGPPVRVDTGDPRTFLYTLDADHHIMWGSERPVHVDGATAVLDSSGRPVAALAQVGDAPRVIVGPARFRFGPSPVVADSIADFGGPNWRYFALLPDGSHHPLALTDWDWTSYFGGTWYKPLRINDDEVVPAGDGAKPIRAVSRYIAPAAMTVRVEGEWSVATQSDGIDLTISHNGTVLTKAIATGHYVLPSLRVTLAKGDMLDIAVGPNQTLTKDQARQHIRLYRAGPS